MKLETMCLIVVAALIVCPGCKTQQAIKHPELQMLTDTHLFIATGCVPVKQTGSSFYYRPKCVACGAVAADQIRTVIPKGTSTVSTEYTCPKCSHKQTVRIVMEERTSNKATERD